MAPKKRTATEQASSKRSQKKALVSTDWDAVADGLSRVELDAIALELVGKLKSSEAMALLKTAGVTAPISNAKIGKFVGPEDVLWGGSDLGDLFSRFPLDKIASILEPLSLHDKLNLTSTSRCLYSLRLTHSFWATVRFAGGGYRPKGSKSWIRIDKAAELLASAPPDSIVRIEFGDFAPAPGKRRTKSCAPEDLAKIWEALKTQGRIEYMDITSQLNVGPALEALAALRFPELRRLTIHGQSKTSGNLRLLAPLLRAATKLEELCTENTIGKSGLRALSGHQNLRRLTIHRAMGEENDDELTFSALNAMGAMPNLEEVMVDTLYGDVRDHFTLMTMALAPEYSQPLPSLRKLIIPAIVAYNGEILMKSGSLIRGILKSAPLLEYFHLSLRPTTFIPAATVAMLEADEEGTWLDLNRPFDGISALPALKTLCLNWFEFDPDDFQKLLSITASLDSLDLKHNRGVPKDYLALAKQSGLVKAKGTDVSPRVSYWLHGTLI